MFGFTTTRRLNAELAAAKAETNRQRDRADKFEKRADTAVFNRQQIARQLVQADADNRRLAGRNLELGRLVSALRESDPEHAAALERRITRLRKVGARILTAYGKEKERADHLATTASPEDIEAWEARAKAHDTWLTPRDLEARPVDGASARPTHPATDLRRALERCRELERRLTQVEGRKGVPA
jgi:hypothetical protein